MVSVIVYAALVTAIFVAIGHDPRETDLSIAVEGRKHQAVATSSLERLERDV